MEKPTQQQNKLPAGWQEVELEKLSVILNRGKSPKYVENSEIKIVNQKCIYWEGINFDNVKYLSEQPKKDFILKEGDILINSTGTGTLGRATVFQDKKGIFTVDSHVTLLRPNEKLDSKFFCFYLKTNQESLYNQCVSGSTNQIELSRSKLLKFKIPLPPFPIQKKIAAILEKVEKLKQKREEADKKTAEYLQSVFYEMFGDPVRNEKRLEIKKLNEICDVRDGTHDSPKYVEEGYPLITSKNLSGGFIDFSEVNLISKEDFDEVNKRSKVDAGDIIMPMIGTIGNPLIVPKNIQEFAIKNVALIKFTKTDVSNIYIKFILDSPYFNQVTKGDNRGGTQKFLALGDIRNMPIPLPSLPLQQKFSKIVEKIEKLKEKQKESKQKIDELFNVLMQKAFRGELVR